MRRLNLLRATSSSHCWNKHQQRCISEAVTALQSQDASVDGSTISPLIPGSYLFNQLIQGQQSEPLVLQSQSIQGRPSVTSLDPVYESLSCPTQWSPGSVVLIDMNSPDQWCMNTLRETLVSLIEDNLPDTQIETLVVLQPHQLTELKNICAAYPVQVQSLHPDWCNPAQMLAYYRSASHTLFINTTRAADAAFCQFPSTLICSQHFIETQKSYALWQVLADAPSNRLLCAVAEAQENDFAVLPLIDNRMADLQSVLCGATDELSDDWLTEYRVTAELNRPVIYADAGWQKTVQAIIDTRISLRRKGQKLQEDPKQFCIDSKNPVLKALGRLLPSRAAA